MTYWLIFGAFVVLETFEEYHPAAALAIDGGNLTNLRACATGRWCTTSLSTTTSSSPRSSGPSSPRPWYGPGTLAVHCLLNSLLTRCVCVEQGARVVYHNLILKFSPAANRKDKIEEKVGAAFDSLKAKVTSVVNEDNADRLSREFEKKFE